jgi:hypothetical protein
MVGKMGGGCKRTIENRTREIQDSTKKQKDSTV